jgi:uncharacterized membrane protein YeaQ/YmgE (transglycosylase-associated protein family)
VRRFVHFLPGKVSVGKRGDAAYLGTERKGTTANMGLLYFLLVGLIAGFLAKYVVPGEGPGGIIGDMIIGIVGAFIGGFVFTRVLGQPGLDGFSLWSILVAFVGAVILLFVLRALTSRRATH